MPRNEVITNGNGYDHLKGAQVVSEKEFEDAKNVIREYYNQVANKAIEDIELDQAEKNEFDTPEAAKYCNVSYSTIQKHAGLGNIKFVRKHHKKNIANVFSKSELDRWVASR